eukprot:EG_transcript_14436
MAAVDFVRRWLTRFTRCPVPSAIPVVWSRLHLYPRNDGLASSAQWITLSIGCSMAVRSIKPNTARAKGRPRKENRIMSVAVQAHLESYGIDVQKVVQRYPPVASYDVERVQKLTAYLARLGVDVKRVVEHHSVVLAGRVEAYEAAVQLLRDNGVDVARAINAYAGVLQRRISTVQRTMSAISNCGHSPADVVNRDPRILRSSLSDLSILASQGQIDTSLYPKMALLTSLGLDVNRLLKKMPSGLSCSVDKIQITVDYLNMLGVDVPKVLHSAPSILGPRADSLKQRVHFLETNGFDVVRQVNGFPQVLLISVEHKLQPLLNFVVQEMRRSPCHLKTAYSIWGYDLKGRLRPRFLYLKSLGVPLPHLITFGGCSDERFVARFARTDLRHYHAWRQQNGHPVRPHHQ